MFQPLFSPFLFVFRPEDVHIIAQLFFRCLPLFAQYAANYCFFDFSLVKLPFLRFFCHFHPDFASQLLLFQMKYAIIPPKNEPIVFRCFYTIFPFFPILCIFLSRNICHLQQITGAMIQTQLAAPVLAYFTQDAAGRKEQVR
ncbi:MAG: hypothetical protein LUH20_04715 [Lachnospiraceae bacterium]|nr:hypothetical protein [Lachnospiraceae bacterium]